MILQRAILQSRWHYCSRKFGSCIIFHKGKKSCTCIVGFLIDWFISFSSVKGPEFQKDQMNRKVLVRKTLIFIYLGRSQTRFLTELSLFCWFKIFSRKVILCGEKLFKRSDIKSTILIFQDLWFNELFFGKKYSLNPQTEGKNDCDINSIVQYYGCDIQLKVQDTQYRSRSWSQGRILLYHKLFYKVFKNPYPRSIYDISILI